MNGPPSGTGTTGTCSSAPRGWVELNDATNGYGFSLPIACVGAPAPFTGLVYPGTYKVTVRGNAAYSNLPAQSVVVQPSLTVSSTVGNLAFDVLTRTVSGTVTLNNVAPSGTGTTGTCSSAPRGWVDLHDGTNGYDFSLPIACLGSPAPFTGLVYPGTYGVTVRGNAAYSNLPTAPFTVVQQLRVP